MKNLLLKKFAPPIAGAATGLLAIAAGVVLGASVVPEGPGPVPVCNGEAATHVLVAQFNPTQNPDRYAEVLAKYQPWAEQGVVIVVEPDAGLIGTDGHDVLVSLISTQSGGFIGKPFVKSKQKPATAGDFMCSFLEDSDDLYYAASRADYIEDHGGADDYYLGGCALEGEGAPGDRACDVLVDSGPVGPFGDPQFSEPDGRDRVWGFTVPKGRTQRINTGDSFGHHYVGRGPGKVIVHGGDCFVRKDGDLIPCSGHEGHPGVGGAGDHVHPCPEGSSDPKFLAGLDGGYTKNRISVFDVEYFGPEKLFAGNDALDPCAYESEDI